MLQQVLRFIGVGAIATLIHVIVALVTQKFLHFPAQGANFTGFCASVGFSYFGHASFTFGARKNHAFQLPRFVLVALIGLATSSTITYIVVTKMSGSFLSAMALVALIVPLMTFLSSKFWVFAANPARENPRWSGVLTSLTISSIFLAVFWDRYINHDTAWYLVATRKWLEGAELYVDLIEVNPPLNFYLTIPAIWLADIFGISDTNGQYLLVAILLSTSLIWVWHLLGAVQWLSPRRGLIVLAATGLAVLIPAGGTIAQREHLMLILILPYLFGYLTSSKPDIGRGAVARAIFAAIGLCIKPYFMLFPIALTLVMIWRRKSLWPILSHSNLVILSMGASYVGLVMTLHPEYLNTVVPMALHVYEDYGYSQRQILENLQPILLGVFALSMLVALRNPRKIQGLGILIVMVVAAVGCYLAQWTGYIYQVLPTITLMILAYIWILSQPGVGYLFALPAFGMLTFIAISSYSTGFYRSYGTEYFHDTVTAISPNPRVMLLSTHLPPSFPLILETNAEWVGHYPALWLMPGAVNGLSRANCEIEVEKCQTLTDILDQTRHNIVTDLAEGSPDILIIDQTPGYFVDRNFDFHAFKSARPLQPLPLSTPELGRASGQ